ncbi:MAG: hypothetical protein LBN06_04420 [Prevotellaceae bacterium]|jgi:hypothetical protein|nr:hypothetical protein [Prevotellaceae bacterium]
MANLFTQITRKVIPAREKRCPACKRVFAQAVEEQLSSGENCPLPHCAFKKEIRKALLESKTPEVVTWEVDKNMILENEEITLSWKVRYAQKVTILNLGNVPLHQDRKIVVHRSTKYTLTIQSYKGEEFEVEKSIDITVFPLPIIEVEKDKFRKEQGDITTLVWSAKNVKTVRLCRSNQDIDVTTQSKYDVKANESLSYSLIFTALDDRTTIEKTIEIEVFPKPEIEFFEATPDVALNSMPVTLSWKVKNALKVEISNIGEVDIEGKKVDLYKESTLHTITVFGELSIIRKNVVIQVFPTPIIESLLVPIPDLKNRVSIASISAKSFNIDLSINNPRFNFSLPEFSLGIPTFNVELPVLNLTTPPFITPANLLLLEELHKESIISSALCDDLENLSKHIKYGNSILSIFNFSKIYNYVRK